MKSESRCVKFNYQHATKDTLMNKLDNIISTIRKLRGLILMGDLYRRTGSKDENTVVGKYGEIKTNNNKEPICVNKTISEYGMDILNIRKSTNRHLFSAYTSTKKTIIDYIITRQNLKSMCQLLKDIVLFIQQLVTCFAMETIFFVSWLFFVSVSSVPLKTNKFYFYQFV